MESGGINEADVFDDVTDELASMTTDDILRRSQLLDNEIRVLRDELQRLMLEHEATREKIKENQEKIKLNKQLPYLVGNVVEILDVSLEDEAEEDGANVDLESQRKGKCAVLKTSTRQVIAGTNRADILDLALMRSGRLDQKIEFPHPTEEARARILQAWLHAQPRLSE